MASTETGWTTNMNGLARTIIERISDAAIELMIARHSLYDDGGEELEQEAVVMMKSDVVACMTGDDPGCNDPDDPDELNESNCELLWLQSILTGRNGHEWADEFPQVEETFYWMRHKLNHADINVGLLRDGTLLLAEGTTHGKSRRKDFEYLPASPSDAEELMELRKAAQTAQDFIEAISRDIHYVYSSEAAATVGHAADDALTQLRAALNPSQSKERKNKP